MQTGNDALLLDSVPYGRSGRFAVSLWVKFGNLFGPEGRNLIDACLMTPAHSVRGSADLSRLFRQHCLNEHRQAKGIPVYPSVSRSPRLTRGAGCFVCSQGCVSFDILVACDARFVIGTGSNSYFYSHMNVSTAAAVANNPNRTAANQVPVLRRRYGSSVTGIRQKALS